jgi:hypothetical protein
MLATLVQSSRLVSDVSEHASPERARLAVTEAHAARPRLSLKTLNFLQGGGAKRLNGKPSPDVPLDT